MTKHERYTLIAAVLGSGIATLDGTVVNIALPAIATSLHTDYTGLQWVVDGYLLTLSTLILLGGSLGDIFGQKRIFQLGVIGFAISSLFCGLAPDITVLTLGRLLQGLSGALLVPSSLAVINTNFAPEHRAKAIGSWTALGAIFVAIGPFVGGLLVGLSWRWIFLINLPFALLCLYYIRIITDPKVSRRPSIDTIGAVLAITALGGTTYGLIEGPAHGWHPFTTLALIVGLISCVVFTAYERKAQNPMLPLTLFKSRNFIGANLSTLGMYAALGGALFSLILYLQTAIGYTPLAAGVALFPVTIMMFLLAGRAGELSGRFGPRFFMSLGPVIIGCSFLLMIRISPDHGNYFIDVLPSALVIGTGLVLTVAPLTATVMGSVGEYHSGIASAVNNAVARLAGLLIVAFLGVLVASQTTQALASSPVKLTNTSVSIVHESIAGGIKHSSISDLPQAQREAIKTTVARAQRGAFVNAMLLNALLCFVSGAIAYILITNPTKKQV